MRRVIAPFILTTTDSERQFRPDDVIDGELARHWYVQYHSVEVAQQPQPAHNAEPKQRRKHP